MPITERSIIQVIGLVLCGVVIAILAVLIYQRYQHYASDELNFHAAVSILRYNVDQGILKVPPELLTPPPPPTLAAPPPAVAKPSVPPDPPKK